MTDIATGADAAGTANNLKELITKAFIDPIRSALIVDDQYPTWDDVFSDGFSQKDKRWRHHNEIKSIISQLRGKSPSLIVDIHDGRNTDDMKNYIRQSDFIILDYDLEGEQGAGNSGTACKSILSTLCESNHFNLCLIHTSKDLKDVFNEIATSLLSPYQCHDDFAGAGIEIIENLQDNNDAITEKIEESISWPAYLAARKCAHQKDCNSIKGLMLQHDLFNDFRSICANAKWTKTIDQFNVLKWALKQKNDNLNGAIEKNIIWKSPDDTENPWIRTDRIFIAFVSKQADGESQGSDILQSLISALMDWQPTPSRLFSSIIRSEISEGGIIAEGRLLNDRHTYWHFYKQLLDPIEPHDDEKESREDYDSRLEANRKLLLEKHIARHMEGLFDYVKEKTINFGLSLISSDESATGNYASHYGLDKKKSVGEVTDQVKKDALKHYNNYVSTKEVSGWHLEAGHVFQIDNSYWICASPACDLVPGQKPGIIMANSSKSKTKPFAAIQLNKSSSQLCDRDITSNNFVFLKIDENIETFKISSSNSDGLVSPNWRILYAKNNGIFDGDQHNFDVEYIEGTEDGVTIKKESTKVVSQLRYEYALNIINKFGTEVTRVGLDFSVYNSIKSR